MLEFEKKLKEIGKMCAEKCNGDAKCQEKCQYVTECTTFDYDQCDEECQKECEEEYREYYEYDE